MSASTFALLLLAQVASDDWRGQITLATGGVIIERGGQQLAGGNRAGLTPADTVQTESDGAAALILPDGLFVYLAPNSRVVIGASNQNALTVESGEIRALVGSDSGPVIRLPAGSASLSRGAFRIQLDGDNVRIGAEAGTLRGAFANMQSITLEQGQEVNIRSGRLEQAMAYSPEGWRVDVEQLLANALEEELRRRRVDRPDPTRGTDQADEPMRRPPGATQNQLSSASISSTSIGSSATAGVSASAGLFSDAAQFTLEGQRARFVNGTLVADPPAPNTQPFPGNIHLVTGETRYGLPGVDLNNAERNNIFRGSDAVYFSIGRGPPPSSQVVTSFNTATNPTPRRIPIPGFNFHVIRFDQYGPVDAALDPAGAQQNNVGYAGLLGTDPAAPVIVGTTPRPDGRAQFNEDATFALGEFRLRADGGPAGDTFELAVRRSDQDRLIVKDPGGNDANDLVAPNPDVGAFDDVPDPRFLPAAPTVKVPRPGTYDASPTRFSRLDTVRRAAATTILADQLRGYASRTGQTRFVIDGRVIDISGYRRP